MSVTPRILGLVRLLPKPGCSVAMQASWGAENPQARPTRAGELYGEQGRWMQSTIESVPWYPSAAEKRAMKAGKVRKWDRGKSTEGSPNLQAQSTKRPAEMDVAPQGVKVTLGSKPGVMTMADHDHGVVWPPPKGHECDLPFQAMVKERKPDYHTEVNGIMVGYQGHVPRARDKVGQCPLGRVPGRPGAPSLSKDPRDPKGFGMSSKSVQGAPEAPLYASEARDPQLKGVFQPGRRIHAAQDPNDTYKGGVPPGYAGHVHGARYSVGQSVYSTADTFGHPDSQGATAKEFSSHVDAKGADFEKLANIYANDFVADGVEDSPFDSFVKRGEVADWVKTDGIVGGGKFGEYGSGAGSS